MCDNHKGPTLNPTYNHLLRQWGNALPECEDCGCDLTGAKVFDIGTMWVCSSCKEADDNTYHEPDYREDFHSDI